MNDIRAQKDCTGCSKCCEWLSAEIYGKPFHKGNFCHFVTPNGCSIYKDRPPLCVSFKCQWLVDEHFPMWMKPSLSNVIVIPDEIKGIPFFRVTEAGNKMESNVLNWILRWAMKHQFNVSYEVYGHTYFMGSEEFHKVMSGPL